MVKRILKLGCIAILTPIALFLITTILLFVPPIQNFVQRKAMTYISEKTGMDITIGRLLISPMLNIDLRQVRVITPIDTLLNAKQLTVDLGMKRIFEGQVIVKGIELNEVSLNTIDLIKGFRVEGKLGAATFLGGDVNLNKKRIDLANASIENTAITIHYIDTIKTPEDTTSNNRFKLINVGKIHVRNVYVALTMPIEDRHMSMNIGDALAGNGTIDLTAKKYLLKQFQIKNTTLQYDAATEHKHASANVNNLTLANTNINLKKRAYQLDTLRIQLAELKYRTNSKKPSKGLDPSHILLRNVRLNAHSLYNCKLIARASISHFSAQERSGFYVKSAFLHIESDSNFISLPNFYLNTPNSEIIAKGLLPWSILKKKSKNKFVANLTAYIGKEDLLLLAGQTFPTLKKGIPFWPLRITVKANGSMDNIQLAKLDADISNVLSLQANGKIQNMNDSKRRNIQVQFKSHLKNVNFMSSIIGQKPKQSFNIPKNISLNGNVNVIGSQYSTKTIFYQGDGSLNINGNYNTASTVYKAKLVVKDLQIHNFLPKDSIYKCNLRLNVEGHGSNIYARSTYANINLNLIGLGYKRFQIDKTLLIGSLKNKQINIHFNSTNELVDMESQLQATVSKKYILGEVSLNIWDADLQKLGLISQPLGEPFVFAFNGYARPNESSIDIHTGDLSLSIDNRMRVERIISQYKKFASVLMRQLNKKSLNQTDLRKVLPNSRINFTSGQENIFAKRLKKEVGITFKTLEANLGTSSTSGINGFMNVRMLKIKTFQLDTINVDLTQDTTGIKINANLINNKKNEYIFSGKIRGIVRNDQTDLALLLLDSEGETSAQLNINGILEKQGVAFHLSNKKPIIAYQAFTINDDNKIFINKNGHIYANIDLKDDIGTEIKVHSNDSIQYKQNILANITNLNIGEITKAIPYLPKMGGLLNGQLSFVQNEKRFLVHTNANILEASYNETDLGDLRIQATYLPDTIANRHIIFGKLERNNVEILRAGGIYNTNGKGNIDKMRATIKDFPLEMLESFAPDRMAEFKGKLNGDLTIKGSPTSPDINGTIDLNSASAYVPSIGMKLNIDNKKITMVDGRLNFDNFYIYAAGKNPFIINGLVDMSNPANITTNLQLNTTNYELINGKQDSKSILFGKLFITLNSTLKGPISNLKMRGNMKVLSNTDITYVMKEARISVQNRLEDMVIFTNFNDSIAEIENPNQTYSLGGMDVLINIQIDKQVQATAFLDPQGTSRVELVGGGNLTMRYTEGERDVQLTGRYTLSSGLLKYDLPVMPLKDFNIQNGSYVQWTGGLTNPELNIKAIEHTRASVNSSSSNSSSRQVNFDITVMLTRTLQNLGIAFDMTAPEDLSTKSQLQGLTAEERSKRAITLLASGMYVDNNSGLNVNDALNSALQKEINQIAGTTLQNTNFSIGMESGDNATNGSMSSLDYTYKFSKKFFNNRVSVIIGGVISSGNSSTLNKSNESFINDISLQYQLDNAGIHYVHIFHNKDTESLLEGDVTQTGVGYVMKKNMNRLIDLFSFKKQQVDSLEQRKDSMLIKFDNK